MFEIISNIFSNLGEKSLKMINRIFKILSYLLIFCIIGYQIREDFSRHSNELNKLLFKRAIILKIEKFNSLESDKNAHFLKKFARKIIRSDSERFKNMIKRYNLDKKAFSLSVLSDFTKISIQVYPLLLSTGTVYISSYATSLFTVAAVVKIMKYTIDKKRPNFENNNSFPSGHSSISIVALICILMFINRYRNFHVFILSSMIIFVSISRIILKKHYIIDVVAGLAIGSLISSFIFYFFSKGLFKSLRR